MASPLPLSNRALEEAWIAILALYGKQFEAQFGSIDGEAFLHWYVGLCENGVTDSVLRDAMSELRRRHASRTDWPPNYSSLLALCLEAAHSRLGLPPSAAAFQEAVVALRCFERHRWSHPAVYQATVQCGVWWLRQQREAVARERFETIYSALCEKVRAGQSLLPAPEPVPALEDRRGEPIGVEDRKGGGRARAVALASALKTLTAEEQARVAKALTSGEPISPEELLPSDSGADQTARRVIVDAMRTAHGECPAPDEPAPAL
jgi:hypothetical protein